MLNKLTKIVLGTTLLTTPLYLNSRASEQLKEDAKIIYEDEKKANYELIRKYVIRDFQEEYIKKVSTRSSTFSKKIQRRRGNTLEEKMNAFIDEYAENHILILDAVKEKKISDREIEILVEKISTNMARDGGHVDYKNKNVIESLKIWCKTRADFFQKLIEAPSPKTKDEKGFREIFNRAYTNKTLQDYLERQHQANKNLYDAMENTLGIKKIFAKSEFRAIREETYNVYETLKKWLGEGGKNEF